MMITGLGMGMTFSPMTAAAMRDVPQRIAGSASGILNTMRNIGQVLGIAILGSYLQNRIGFFTTEELSGSEVDAASVDQVAKMASQNQFNEIMAMLPDNILPDVMHRLNEAFVSAIHSTFLVGAIACAFGAAAALMLRNPQAHRAREAAPATTFAEERLAKEHRDPVTVE
jgi:hypothetical protein